MKPWNEAMNSLSYGDGDAAGMHCTNCTLSTYTRPTGPTHAHTIMVQLSTPYNDV